MKNEVSEQMPNTKNLTVFILSIISGILLIVSGIHGSIGVYETILSTVALFFKHALAQSIIGSVALILILLASLGGFSVILGGYLIYKNRIRTGKFMIGLGASVGLPGLILILLTLTATQQFSLIIAQYGIIGWTGIALSLITRAVAK